MKKLAIALFHLGYSDYQRFNLALAVKNNPDAHIALITNNVDHEYPDGVTIYDSSEYDEMVEKFSINYEHLTTCVWPFEFRGIIRWLIYNEWWKAHPEYDLFVADSDVMICSDLTREADKWRNYPHTLSMGTAGGQSYWFNRNDAMQRLVDLMWYVYDNKDSPEAQHVFNHYKKLQEEGKPGGVCDMTFLGMLKPMLMINHGETTDIINGTTFDHNILMSQGYEFEQERKVVKWIDGHPYCRKIDTGELIRFHTLHMSCSGGLIEGFYQQAIQ